MQLADTGSAKACARTTPGGGSVGGGRRGGRRGFSQVAAKRQAHKGRERPVFGLRALLGSIGKSRVNAHAQPFQGLTLHGFVRTVAVYPPSFGPNRLANYVLHPITHASKKVYVPVIARLVVTQSTFDRVTLVKFTRAETRACN